MIIVGSKRTGEFYTRRSWFGLGKPITLERIECQAVELDMTGRGEQFSVTRWERVDSSQKYEGQ